MVRVQATFRAAITTNHHMSKLIKIIMSLDWCTRYNNNVKLYAFKCVSKTHFKK